MRLLIIEDDQEIVRVLRNRLKSRYTVDAAATGAEGANKAEMNSYDLIILDLGLPDIDGFDVCRTIRQVELKTPILILTADDDVNQKVTCLDAGADDYLTKPFSLTELEARIRALLRRAEEKPAPSVLTVDDLKLDIAGHKVLRGEKEIRLRRKEFDILEYLMRNRGKSITRNMLIDHAWDTEAEVWTNAIDVHVKNLRDKVDRPFKKKLIKTVHGIGYKIEA